MTIQLFAQPYDIDAAGFYFSDYETYKEKSSTLRNRYGAPVEEFEIQLIDAEALDCAFAKAWGLSQANVAAFLAAAESWTKWPKLRFIIAVGENDREFDPQSVGPYCFEPEIYEFSTLRELAEHYIDEGLFGEIPQRLENYIDYDAIARDLSLDHAEITIAGEHYTYSYH